MTPAQEEDGSVMFVYEVTMTIPNGGRGTERVRAG